VDPEEVRRQKNININYDINLKNTAIVPKQTPFGEKTVLRVEYAFSINYLSPNVGHIRFEGYSDYYSDEDDLNQLFRRRRSESDQKRLGCGESPVQCPEPDRKHDGLQPCPARYNALVKARASASDAASSDQFPAEEGRETRAGGDDVSRVRSGV
jgi:hypothetical protein